VPNRDEAATPAWWIPYKDAILETDQGRLADRIRAAEEAIRARASLDGQVSSDERIELQHAMAGLLILRREMGHSRDDKIKRQRDAWESKWAKPRLNPVENAGLRLNSVEGLISR
jgi:hypothetical protein